MRSTHPLSEVVAGSRPFSPALELAMRPRILIAEDDEDLALALQIRLGQFYDVRVETDGRQTFSSYREERPEVLLLDYQLPDTNGIRLLQSIHRSFGKETPAILMTAYSSRETASLSSGFCSYIQKPCSSDELISIIETVLDLQPSSA